MARKGRKRSVEPEHPWLVPRRKMMSRKLDASAPFTGFFDFGAYGPSAQNDGAVRFFGFGSFAAFAQDDGS